MTSHEYTDQTRKKKICFTCVAESFLSAEINLNGKRGKCSYCETLARCYSLERLAERVEEAFESHYVRTSDQPYSLDYAMMSDKESNYCWCREGEPVAEAIMNAAGISKEAAEDVHEILADKYSDIEAAKCNEETEFDTDSHYAEKPIGAGEWWGKWREFERSLTTETRFFSRNAFSLLQSAFEGIGTMKSYDGRPAVVKAGSETELPAIFRARFFQSEEDLEIALAHPELHLGPPPSARARAGRMNAEGISVFYGADRPEVALAEVRPPVGSWVVVARFDIVRPLRLMDLEALTEIWCHGSIFDPKYISHLERVIFLRHLAQLIGSPVLPDRERLEYLPTQAIADFLATGNTPSLDGMIFPSVQAGKEGLNLVLFHKAARVEWHDLPKGTKVSVSLGHQTEDGWETDYTVFEETPAEKPSNVVPAKESPGLWWTVFEPIPFGDHPKNEEASLYAPTLRIDRGNIEVRQVVLVEFKTDDNCVRYYRREQRT